MSVRGPWYRGDRRGLPRIPTPAWFARDRCYASWYARGGAVVEMRPGRGRILNLLAIGIDHDGAAISKMIPRRTPAWLRAALEAIAPTSGEMYEWAEKAYPLLAEAGYFGVAVRQWHSDYGDAAEDSLLYWGVPQNLRSAEPCER